MRELRFDKSVKGASHTVQLSRNRFIVCHGSSSSLHRVCVINIEGQIMKSYGEKQVKGEGQLSEAKSVTIDKKNKRIFVADHFNHRVLMFDTDLKYLGQVHTPDDLWLPTRLYFDPLTGRLFVCELNRRLLVISPPD